MKSIAIVSGSVRKGRQTHKVASYLHNFINNNQIAKSTLIDLKTYNFPVFEERYRFIDNPTNNETQYQKLINDTDYVIIVSPEYNLGIPAAVKNVIDFLFDEWKGKKVAFATVSAGSFGARNVWVDLVKLMVHLKAIPSGTGFFMPTVQENFDEDGNFISNENNNRTL